MCSVLNEAGASTFDDAIGVIEKSIADRATYDKAHQFPVGISYVLVNGQIVLSVDKLTGASG